MTRAPRPPAPARIMTRDEALGLYTRARSHLHALVVLDAPAQLRVAVRCALCGPDDRRSAAMRVTDVPLAKIVGELERVRRVTVRLADDALGLIPRELFDAIIAAADYRVAEFTRARPPRGHAAGAAIRRADLAVFARLVSDDPPIGHRRFTWADIGRLVTSSVFWPNPPANRSDFVDRNSEQIALAIRRVLEEESPCSD